LVVALGVLLPHEIDHAADSADNSKHCQDDSSDGSSIHFAFFRLGGRALNSLETDHRIGSSCKSNSILGDKGGTKSQVANGVLLDSEEAIRSGLYCKISRLKVEGVFKLVLRDEGEHHVSVCSGAGGGKHGQASGSVGSESLASSKFGGNFSDDVVVKCLRHGDVGEVGVDLDCELRLVSSLLSSELKLGGLDQPHIRVAGDIVELSVELGSISHSGWNGAAEGGAALGGGAGQLRSEEE